MAIEIMIIKGMGLFYPVFVRYLKSSISYPDILDIYLVASARELRSAELCLVVQKLY